MARGSAKSAETYCGHCDSWTLGELRRRAAEALAEIGVDVPSLELAVGALSGGQHQAIALARAVYPKARILLLDEPLAAMGAREARLIMASLSGSVRAATSQS